MFILPLVVRRERLTLRPTDCYKLHPDDIPFHLCLSCYPFWLQRVHSFTISQKCHHGNIIHCPSFHWYANSQTFLARRTGHVRLSAQSVQSIHPSYAKDGSEVWAGTTASPPAHDHQAQWWRFPSRHLYY